MAADFFRKTPRNLKEIYKSNRYKIFSKNWDLKKCWTLRFSTSKLLLTDLNFPKNIFIIKFSDARKFAKKLDEDFKSKIHSFALRRLRLWNDCCKKLAIFSSSPKQNCGKNFELHSAIITPTTIKKKYTKNQRWLYE